MPAKPTAPTRSPKPSTNAAPTASATAPRLREDGDLLNYVNDHRIPLEVCPSSNLQTKAAQNWDAHPVDFYVDYGLRVTINTDNRLITDTTVSKELWLCHKAYGWDLKQIKEIVIAGFKSAFLPYREKSDLLVEVTRELEAFHEPSNGKAVESSGTRPTPYHDAGCVDPNPDPPPEPERSTDITR